MLKCELCPKEAKSKAGLSAHMRQHKKNPPVNTVKPEDTLKSEAPIEPPKEQTALKVPEVKEPVGIVGGGHAVLIPLKKNVESLKPTPDAVLVKGDKVQDVNKGDKFTVHAVDGNRIARQVNQTPDGIKWYDRSTLTKL